MTDQCDPETTCYTPQQLEVAYGIQPLLQRGIDGRGETVVLPELAESQLSPPLVTDLRQDMAGFDRLFHLPAARLRVVTTLAGAGSPWLAFGEEVLDAEVVHASPRAPPSPSSCSRDIPGQRANAVAASVAALRLGRTPAASSRSARRARSAGSTASPTRRPAAERGAQADAGRHVTVVAASGDIGAAGRAVRSHHGPGRHGASYPR